MRDFVITTETNSDLTEDFIKENGIGIIPHYYTVEEDMYGEDKVLTNKEFYDEMRAGKKVGTMASNPAVILDTFTEYAKAGKDILHISFSSGMSSGYQNVVNGANEVMEEYPDCKIIVIDTLSASNNEAVMIIKALEMKKEGKSVQETADWINENVKYLCTLITVETLEYLFRGGRVSRSSKTLGNMLNLKPILRLNYEGKLVAAAKVRGRKKSFSEMIELMDAMLGSYKDPAKQIRIGVVHGDCLEDAETVKKMIIDRFGFPDEKVECICIGPSIGAHSGPGTIGIMFMGDLREA